MKDLIIGTSTYKDIDKLRVRATDGSIATFHRNIFDGGIVFADVTVQMKHSQPNIIEIDDSLLVCNTFTDIIPQLQRTMTRSASFDQLVAEITFGDILDVLITKE